MYKQERALNRVNGEWIILSLILHDHAAENITPLVSYHVLLQQRRISCDAIGNAAVYNTQYLPFSAHPVTLTT